MKMDIISEQRLLKQIFPEGKTKIDHFLKNIIQSLSRPANDCNKFLFNRDRISHSLNSGLYQKGHISFCTNIKEDV